jgi:hypothetical protein
MQLAGEVLKYMNDAISSQGAKKFGIQFGAYATFLSFFGLVDLPKANGDFMGVVDYASSMTFELFTEKDASAGFPGTDDLQVRFLFHNGTASNTSAPVAYPLFGGSANAVSWNDFQSRLDKFAIKSTQQWCEMCGNIDGRCFKQAYVLRSDPVSPAIAGFIGALVTAFVFGVVMLLMHVSGLRLANARGREASVKEKA